MSTCTSHKPRLLPTQFYPPLAYNKLTTNLFEGHFQRARKTQEKTQALPPWPTMEPEAAQDSDAPVARCPDAPIESTAPL